MLRDVSLEIAPGEMVVLVGRTGSGKSTLARILATLCDPGTGRVLYDGIEVERYDRAMTSASAGGTPATHETRSARRRRFASSSSGPTTTRFAAASIDKT